MEGLDIATLEQVIQMDLLTASGIAALTLVLMQIIKANIINRLVKATSVGVGSTIPNYGIIINLLTFVVAIGASFGVMLIDDQLEWRQAMYNGVLGGIEAIGGYEAIKNLFKSVTGVKQIAKGGGQ